MRSWYGLVSVSKAEVEAPAHIQTWISRLAAVPAYDSVFSSMLEHALFEMFG